MGRYRVRHRQLRTPKGTLSTAQAAAILGVPESRVRGPLRKRLKGRKVGSRIRYPRTAVFQVAAEMGRPAPRTPTYRPGAAAEISQRDRTSRGLGPWVAALLAAAAVWFWVASHEPDVAAPSPPAPFKSYVPSNPYFQQSQPHAVSRGGTISFSVNRQGTCSWHGGVVQWVVPTPFPPAR